jgi:hypothetical protein
MVGTVVRRRASHLGAALAVALLVGTVALSAEPASAQPHPPKAPALCSLVTTADLSAALGTPVPRVLGMVKAGSKAVTVLEKQNDVAMTAVIKGSSKVTLCFTAFVAIGGPTSGSPSGPPSGSPTGPTMNYTFFNPVSKSSLLGEKHNFQVESGSGTRAGIANYEVTNVPGVGDAAFSLGPPSVPSNGAATHPVPTPGEMLNYDLFVLVGKTQVHISVSGTAPNPTDVQTFASTLATALRRHGSS